MSLPHRTERMAALIYQELARILVEDIADPGLRNVTITRVELTGDLKQAHVFFTAAGQPSAANEKQTLQGFKRAVPFFRRRLGGNLDLRYVPELQFRKDSRWEAVQNVLKLIDESQREPGEKF